MAAAAACGIGRNDRQQTGRRFDKSALQANGLTSQIPPSRRETRAEHKSQRAGTGRLSQRVCTGFSDGQRPCSRADLRAAGDRVERRFEIAQGE